MNTRISRGEHLEALAWGLALAVLCSLPYAYGYLASPADKYYLGFVLNSKDQNTYFMWMTQAAQGDILLRNLYTSIPHDGAMLNLFFLLGGLLTRLLGSLDAAYQLLRVLSIILLGWSTWLFVGTFLEQRGQRRWIFLLTLFGAGLGWVWNVSRLISGDVGHSVTDMDLLARPFDLWVPEGYVFYSMLIMPHFTAAIALLMLTVRWAALGLSENNLRLTTAAGLICLFLSFVHPYDVLIALALAFGVSALHALRAGTLDIGVWRHALLLLALSAGPILYNYWILNANPGMKAWLVQNKSASPPPLGYLAGYGLLMAGAVAFLVSRFRDLGRSLAPWQWIAAWCLVLPLAVYAPIDFQRRLAIAASAPMALATGMVLLEWVQRLRLEPAMKRNLLLLLFIGATSLTSAFHFLNSFRKASDYSGEMFVNRDTVAALQWVGRQDTTPGGTVLAGFDIGNYAPRFTGLPTVIGSRGQTGNFDQVLRDTHAFYSGEASDGQMRDFLEDHRVAWVVLATAEHPGLAADLPQRLSGLGLNPVYGAPDSRVRVFAREQ